MAGDQLSLYGLKYFINSKFSGKEPWQIVTITASTVLAGVWLRDLLFQSESLSNRSRKFFFRIARKIPFVAREIEAEKNKVADSFEKEVNERNEGVPYMLNLNEKGMTREEIVQEIQKHLDLGDYDWKNGFVSGAVYYYSEELVELLTKVYGMASYTNPLHVDIFPGICKMEAEIVRICANLFHGTEKACGTMTSGGTESIIMACKAYRDYGLYEKGIQHPEMVLPRTAHPAFEKAASYFGITIRYVSVDPLTTCVSLKEMKRAISKNTVMLVGSVPNYPYGTMDDIQGIAALGRLYDIPVHVDCCLGGFLTAFMPQAGFLLPAFDFAVSGVTSISADTHKYGFAPKGSSVILYSHPKYRHQQYCVTTDWPGGIYGSPTVNGSRAGGIIATCWAALMYFGLNGYIDATKRILNTSKYIENELRKLQGIYVFGKPVTSVVAIGSNSFHIYRLCEKMNAKGWNLNTLQFPPGIHICLTYMHTLDGVAERFVSDIKSGLEEIKNEPNIEMEGKMAMYGMTQSLPDRALVGDFTRIFIDSMYYTPTQKKIEESKVANGN